MVHQIGGKHYGSPKKGVVARSNSTMRTFLVRLSSWVTTKFLTHQLN